jgi:hypothetical protein
MLVGGYATTTRPARRRSVPLFFSNPSYFTIMGEALGLSTLSLHHSKHKTLGDAFGSFLGEHCKGGEVCTSAPRRSEIAPFASSSLWTNVAHTF